MKPVTHLQEIQVSYNKVKSAEFIKTSSQAYAICKQAYIMSDACVSLKEYFFVTYLNRANKVIGFYMLSAGGITGTTADLRIAFSIGLKCLAVGIILCHNHPSGNINPSDSDIELTRKFVKTGELLEIKVLDHIIMTPDEYYSMSDNGQL